MANKQTQPQAPVAQIEYDATACGMNIGTNRHCDINRVVTIWRNVSNACRTGLGHRKLSGDTEGYPVRLGRCMFRTRFAVQVNVSKIGAHVLFEIDYRQAKKIARRPCRDNPAELL